MALNPVPPVPPTIRAGGTGIHQQYQRCYTRSTLFHQKINVLLHARRPTMTTPKNGRESWNLMLTCRATKPSGWQASPLPPMMARTTRARNAAAGISGARAARGSRGSAAGAPRYPATSGRTVWPCRRRPGSLSKRRAAGFGALNLWRTSPTRQTRIDATRYLWYVCHDEHGRHSETL